MPRNAGTGVYTRVVNSFSQPVFGTLIDPTDADSYFDDLDVGLNPANLAGPVAIVGALSVSTTLNKITITPPATSATLTLIDGTTLTGPAASGTVMTLGNNETVTGVKTFGSAGAVSRFAVAGNTSGSTIVNATAIASGILTLPAATDTLVGKATTDVLTNKTFDSAGTGNVLQVSGVTVSRGQYPGESTTGSATAGNIGQYIESVIATGSSVSLVTGTAKNLTSISLTAGDWDVQCVFEFDGNAATTLAYLGGSLSLTTDTSDFTSGRSVFVVYPAGTLAAITPIGFATGSLRFSLSGTTTVFGVAQASFAVNTMKVYGILKARRMR